MERAGLSRPDSTQIWSISDGRAGNARQADALASALSAATRSLTLAPRAPWRWWSPRRLPGSDRAYGAEFQALLDLPPPLAIGCGRQAALATRLLRERGARSVQILDPRLDPRHWDLVVAPEHDGLAGPNVITLLGSLHPVDDAWLARAREDFAHLADLPGPRTTLLVGGPTRQAPYDAARVERLIAELGAWHATHGGSVLATTSRRTPPGIVAALRHGLSGHPGLLWTVDTEGRNPYPGLLAWADRIVCSPDSVNMVSEACATRVPVHVFDGDHSEGRPRRFLDALRARRRLASDLAAADPATGLAPLRETARVAAELRRRLSLPASIVAAAPR